MIKRINSSTGNYEEQVTDTLVLDTVPTVNSFNAVTSDGIARAIAGASGEVPQVTENDNGKVLTAIYDAGGPAVEWSTNGLVPASTSEDSGKVLTVNSTGTPAWKMPSGTTEWWGGEPEPIVLGAKQIRLLFKNSEYDPRNDSDTSFLDRFTSITKENDGSYTFQFKKGTTHDHYASGAFNNKYTIDTVGEFVVLAWSPELLSGEGAAYDNYDYLFNLCTGLRAVYNVDWRCGQQQTDLRYAFGGCVMLKTYRHYRRPLSSAHSGLQHYIRRGTGMFSGCVNLEDVYMSLKGPLPSTANVWSFDSMFSGCEKLKVGPQILGGATSTYGMFSGCFNLETFCTVPSEADNEYHSKVFSCNCQNMFLNCRSLVDASALAEFFASVKVSNAADMFMNCSSLRVLPKNIYLYSNSDVDCQNMFSHCYSLIELPVLDYANVTNARAMFAYSKNLIDISSLSSVTWNAGLTNVELMFSGCEGVRTGLLGCYNGLSANTSITDHIDTFSNCGRAWSNPDLANIPASWGGTGA